MKINFPNKPNGPEFSYSCKRIVYYPTSTATKTKEIKLPSWLSNLIIKEVDSAEKRGRCDLQEKLKDLLDIVDCA